MTQPDIKLRIVDDGRIITETAYQIEQTTSTEWGLEMLSLGLPLSGRTRLVIAAVAALALYWWMASAGTKDSTATLVVLASVAGLIIALIPQWSAVLTVCELITHWMNSSQTPDALVGAEGLLLAGGVIFVWTIVRTFIRARGAM